MQRDEGEEGEDQMGHSGSSHNKFKAEETSRRIGHDNTSGVMDKLARGCTESRWAPIVEAAWAVQLYGTKGNTRRRFGREFDCC